VTEVTYAYSLRQDALDASLSSLDGVNIVSPARDVSGTRVPFIVVTLASVSRVDFYVVNDAVETQVCIIGDYLVTQHTSRPTANNLRC
jgi:hypothetical protein